MSKTDPTMSRRAFVVSVAGAALTTVSRSAWAAPPPSLDEALKKVSAARDGLKSLTGPFTQERTIGLLAAKVKSTGTLTLVRPDRLRWELAAPDGIVYWVGPEGLAYKSARGGQGRVPPTHARIAAALEDLRLVLAGDLGALKLRYELSLPSATDEVFSFSAVPRDPNAKLKRIDFDLDVTGGPRKVVLVEGAKDKTEIVFGTLVRDSAIQPEAMRPQF